MMKKIFLFLLVFPLIAYSQSGWFWVNPLPQGNNLNSIFVFGYDSIISVGNAGSIIRTYNGGFNWSYTVPFPTINLNDVHFANLQTGFSVGRFGTVIKTTNGGNNWTLKPAPFPTIEFHGVITIDVQTPIIVGDYGTILKSTNGGDNWTQPSSGTTSIFYGIHFINSLTGFITGTNGTVLKTTDAGNTWSPLARPDTSAFLKDVQFINSSTGFVVGYIYNGVSYDPKIYKTTNGGLNWTLSTPQTDGEINSIHFPNNGNIGYAVGVRYDAFGPHPRVFKTTDAGVTWFQVFNSTLSGNFNNVRFINSTTGYTSSHIVITTGVTTPQTHHFIYKTTNGGTNWQPIDIDAFNITDPLLDIKITFVDENIGYALEDNHGKVYKTTNGGHNWTIIYTIPTGFTKGIYFINSNIGYILTSDGKIWRTFDGGQTWAQSTVSQNQHSMHFPNSTTGYTAGDGGSFGKTTNGGVNWNITIVGLPTDSFKLVKFLDINTGFIAGKPANRCFRTTNGGINWYNMVTSPTPPSYKIFRAMDFSIPYGVVVGDSGLVYRTTNSGVSWYPASPSYPPRSTHLHSVQYLSTNQVVTVGDTGKIYTSTDYGYYWINQITCTDNNLQYVNFFNSLTGIITGDKNTIIKTTTGGVFVGIQQQTNEIPERFYLYQNYPNPFNPKTKIRFDVPSSPLYESGAGGFIILKVYDILGREVATLVNEQLKPGTYEVEFDGSNFASGVYYYRIAIHSDKLETQNYSETKKLVIVK